MKVFIFDYDGTITTEDTTDIILDIPGNNQIWRIEDQWKQRVITSYQCMKAQARFLKGITIEELHHHLHRHSHVDPAFSTLVQFLRRENYYPLILSEGYDLSLAFHEVHKQIDTIHSSHLLTTNEQLTGELRVSNERTWDYNKECLGCCICKVDYLLQLRKQCNVTKSVAVGDGGSDACLFRYVDVSFSLNPKYEATHQVNNLSEVYTILQESVGC